MVGIPCMRAFFLIHNWETMGVPSALPPIGQLHQSPPSPVPGFFCSLLPIITQHYQSASHDRIVGASLSKCAHVCVDVSFFVSSLAESVPNGLWKSNCGWQLSERLAAVDSNNN